jgi:hypothetical protein
MPIITTITSVRVSMITIQTIAMIVGSLIFSALTANATIISNGQIIYDDENNKIISKQFSDIYSAIKKKNKNKNKNSGIVNCYLKWDDQVEEKNYLEKMHNEIINTPLKETFKRLHKFGYLGYLREEDVFDGESYIIKHLFSEAWSEEGNNKKDRYCIVRSDALKARLPKAIEIIIQRAKLEENKNKNKVKTAITTRKTIRRQRHQNQQQEEETYSSRVKSLKDFV